MRLKCSVRYLFAIVLIALLQFSAHAQETSRKIDSIYQLLKVDKEDTNKLFHYLDLATYYSNLNSLDTSLLFANKALTCADELLAKTNNVAARKVIGDSKSSAYFKMGSVNLKKNELAKAEKNYESALKVAEEFGNKEDMVFYYGYIGYAYSLMDNYPEAIKNFQTCLNIADTVPAISKSDIEKYTIRLGIVYSNQGNYPEALTHFFTALKLSEETGDKLDQANAYGNIANIYDRQENHEQAIIYVMKSLQIKTALGDSAGMTYNYNILGDIYFSEGKNELSIVNYQKAIDIANALGDESLTGSGILGIGNVYLTEKKYDNALKNFLTYQTLKEKEQSLEGMSAAYGSIASVYIKQKKFAQAETYLKKGLDLSKETGDKLYLRDFYLAYAQLDSAKGDYKGAFENHKLYDVYSDSLNNEEVRKKTMQSEMTYEFDKKAAVATAEHKKEMEEQSMVADEKSHKQKIVLGCVVVGLLVVIVFAGFVFRSLRNTRRQKNEIEHQKHLVEEKQKEILDSIHYAKRIQRSLMPTEKYIHRSITRLKKN